MSIYKNIEKEEIKAYKKTITKYLLTTRFNGRTWKENEEYRKNKLPNGCFYGSYKLIAKEIPDAATIMVIEMNNHIERIMGIGLLVNIPHLNKYKIYKDEKQNKNVYVGRRRIDRKDMTPEEELIMQALDKVCFTQMKRGRGIRAFPANLLLKIGKVIDIVEYIENMFKERVPK